MGASVIADGGASGAGRDRDETAARRLGWTLAILAAARAALAFVPWSGLWGLGPQRFLPPAAAWIPWGLAAVALVPAAGRALAPALTRAGETLARRPRLSLALAGIGAAALVWLLPDQIRWVGDSILRLGAVRVGMSPEVISPQALPLDTWLHYTLPLGLTAAGWTDAETAVRLAGAAGAAVLAALACAFALTLEAGAAARIAAAAVVFFGGYLCLFTGESKAFAEICLAVAAFGAIGLRVLRHGRGLLSLGLVMAAALSLHREALGLVPAFAFVWAVWLARRGREGAWRRPGIVLAMAVPAAMLAALGPRLWATLAGYDLSHNFLTAGARGGAGLAAAIFRPTRLLDLLSATLLLSPLALALPPLFAARAGGGSRPQGENGALSTARQTRDTEGRFLLALAAPFLAAALLARPPQGLIRDWDGLGAMGMSLSLLAAWRIARALSAPGQAWRAAAVALAVAAPALQWLLFFHEPARALSGIEALVAEPPARVEAERARTWDFLGWKRFARQDWEASTRAFEKACELAPSPRLLAQWAMGETMLKDYAKARALYRRSVEKDPSFTIGWTGVAVAAIWFDDLEDCERAARQLERLAPRDPKTREILDYLAKARAAPAGTP